MKTLLKLGATLTLALALAVSAYAGEIPTGPGPGEMNTPPCVQGEVNTPPCASASASLDDATGPGITDTPPASESIDILSLAEIGLRSLLLF
jgi:hypothetical protein